MMELDDESMEDMMEKLKSGIKTPTGAGNEPKITESALEGLRKNCCTNVNERRRLNRRIRYERQENNNNNNTTTTEPARDGKRSKSTTSTRAREGGRRGRATATRSEEKRSREWDAATDSPR